MAKSVTTRPKKKGKKFCGYPVTKTGLPCKGHPVKGGDGRCLFHSKVPKVMEKLHQGRISGAHKTVLRQISASSLLVLKKIRTTAELLSWVNTLNSDFYHRRISREDVVVFLALANSLAKILDTREVVEELQKLKDQVSSME